MLQMLPDFCMLFTYGPSTSDVLAQTQNHQVCTSSQCFETIEDLVPMPNGHLADPSYYYAVMTAVALLWALLISKRSADTHLLKPRPENDDTPPPSAAA